MSDKKFIVNPGDEIIITVPGGNNQRNSSSVSHRTQKKGAMMPVPGPDEILGRRLKKGGYLNFYDFGQILVDGVLKDLPLHFDAYDGSNLPGNTPPTFSAFDWNSLNTLIFAVPTGEWKTKFRKLEFETAEKYGLDVAVGTDVFNPRLFPVARNASRLNSKGELVANTKWTDKGLKLESTDNVRFISASAFVDFMIGRLDAGEPELIEPFRVTEVPSAAGETVENFKLKAGASVFLVPKPSRRFIATDNMQLAPNHKIRTLVGAIGISSRAKWLDDWLDSEYPILSYFNVTRVIPDEKMNEIIADLRAETETTHQFVWNDSGDSDTNSFDNLDLNALLYGSFQEYNQHTSTFEYRNQLNLNAQIEYSPEGLVAAIQQNDSTYYVWKNEAGAIGTLDLNYLSFLQAKKWKLSISV